MLKKKQYRGRFAPSPSGDLHFGSLVTAMASYVDARHNQGGWIIRVDDIDTPRVIKGSTQSILATLENLGFQWDEPIYYQSSNKSLYEEVINDLYQSEHVYPCSCSRKEISQINASGIYSGTCKNKIFAENVTSIKTQLTSQKVAMRVSTPADEITFNDVIQGKKNYSLAQLSGDFIVYRSDNVISYQLAFVIDNNVDRVTHIVRASDLLDSTPKQIYLQNLLSYPIPEYAHLPIITNSKGMKLSKSCQAPKVDININTLVHAANILGQTLDNRIDSATMDEFWKELIRIWDINKVPKLESIPMAYPKA